MLFYSTSRAFRKPQPNKVQEDTPTLSGVCGMKDVQMSVPLSQRAKHRGHGFTGTALRTAAGCLKNVKQLSIISFCWYGSTWRAMASWCAMVNLDPAEIRSERLHCRCDCLGGCFVARRPRRSHPRATPTSHRSPFCTWIPCTRTQTISKPWKVPLFLLGPLAMVWSFSLEKRQLVQ